MSSSSTVVLSTFLLSLYQFPTVMISTQDPETDLLQPFFQNRTCVMHIMVIRTIVVAKVGAVFSGDVTGWSGTVVHDPTERKEDRSRQIEPVGAGYGGDGR